MEENLLVRGAPDSFACTSAPFSRSEKDLFSIDFFLSEFELVLLFPYYTDLILHTWCKT